MKLRFVVAVALALAVGARPSLAQPSYPLLYGNESVAAADGARGALVNPAAVGTRYPGELVLGWTRFTPEAPGVLSAALAAGGLGLYGETRDERPELTGVSLAGGRLVRFGLAHEWRRDRITGERSTNVRIGLLTRPTPWISFGGTLDNDGGRGQLGTVFSRRATYGLGLRPLALDRTRAHTWGTRLTLTADMTMTEGHGPEDVLVRFGAEFEPVLGLALRGSLDNQGVARLGFGVLGVHSGVHAQSTRDDANRVSETYSVSLHAAEDRTVFVAPALKRVAVIRAGGTLGDESMGGVSLLGGDATVSVAPLHHQLERALEDPLTRGVLLDLRGVGNMAQLEELKPRILALRSAGKPVVAYMEYGGGRGDLYLASACTRAVTTEEALFGGLGLRVEKRAYKSLLADWGLKLERSSMGEYKSAYRNYSTDSVPAPDREVIERNLDVSQELFVSSVATDRHMDRARLLTLLDGRQWTPADLVAAGLIDSVGYREDALRMLGRLSGMGDKPRAVNLERTLAARPAWRLPTPVAVVYASGGIEAGRSGNDLLLGPYMGSDDVIARLERAFHNPFVKVVVFRVESTGGSGLASNLIHHALERLKRETHKPLIVSMGGVAGSGGYYIALPGDKIFADRYTRTGSIGVLTVKPSVEGWFAQHHVREQDYERGRYMGAWSTNRDWTPEFQASADSAIGTYYRGFVTKVAQGRKLSFAAVDSVARGRVWMGEDARARGLVDEIGGLERAIAEARTRAGIPAAEKIRVLEYRRPRAGFVERLIGTAIGEAWDRSARLPEPGAVYYRVDDQDD